MKKKITAGILSAVLIAGMALPVSASDTENMTVTYTQAESYVLSIPASAQGLNLSSTQEVTTDVGVSQVNLAPGNKIVLKVTAGVDASGIVKLERNEDNETIQSSLTVNATPVKLNEVFAEFIKDDSETLNFSTLKTASGGTDIKAGDYSGTLTFTANIVPETTTTP